MLGFGAAVMFQPLPAGMFGFGIGWRWKFGLRGSFHATPEYGAVAAFGAGWFQPGLPAGGTVLFVPVKRSHQLPPDASLGLARLAE